MIHFRNSFQQVWLWVVLIFGCLGFSFLSIQWGTVGLDEARPMGAFADGRLPGKTPTATIPWEVVPAYPNLSFTDPVEMIELPGLNRFLVAGKRGWVWTFDKTDPLTETKTVVLDLRSQVKMTGDGGLLGAIAHPEFGQAGSPNAGHLYLHYHHSPDLSYSGPEAYIRLSRFTMDLTTGLIDPASEYVLIQQYDRHTWHNGGGLAFSPEGYLFVSFGDEGGIFDPLNSTQQIHQGFFGGLLRLDVDQELNRSHAIRRQPYTADGRPDGWPESFSQGYTIPNGNPWQDAQGGVLEEYYAIGLRSPHRVSCDPVTGEIWVGDVGQSSREEVNLVEKGANMQWPYKEGLIDGQKSKPTELIGTELLPIHSYRRSEGFCVIGGLVYRGAKWPQLTGKYLFGDHSSRKIWSLTREAGMDEPEVQLMGEVPAFGVGDKAGLSSFATDAEGELYVLKLYGHNLDGGRIYRLQTSPPVPEPPQWLSETGLFENTEELIPAPSLIPYELNMPFWSDGALKRRWMMIPNDGQPDQEAEQIRFSESGEWTFPIGAVMVKHFEMALDESKPDATRRLETRLLVHGEDSLYYGVTYRWNEAQTDAELLRDGQRDTLVYAGKGRDRTVVWDYPSRSQCTSCHTQVAGGVLGPKTRQLNGLIEYPETGRMGHQIRTLAHLGFFESEIDTSAMPDWLTAPQMGDASASTEARARAYLDANCAYCHRPGNSIQANFDARMSTPMESQWMMYGYTHNNLGRSGMQEIAPGDLEHSMIYQRMLAVHESYAMPPLAKNLMDSAGVELMADWIMELAPGREVNNLVSVGNVQADYQEGQVADGWKYLWNASGPLGDASHYQALQWNGVWYDSDGVEGLPDPTDLSLGRIHTSGGYPGPSITQGQPFERFVIAAFEIPAPGVYALTNATFSDASNRCGDGVTLRVLLNDEFLLKNSVGNGESTSFNLSLGELSAGDVIYVAAGPGEYSDACDGFLWQFDISQSNPQTHQVLHFPPIASQSVGDGPIDLTAWTSSDLPVSYEVLEGPATIGDNQLLPTGEVGRVKVRATQAGNGEIEAALSVERTYWITPDGAGEGTGLLATYYQTPFKQEAVLVRTDSVVDAFWGTSSPASSVPEDGFSVVWEGEIEAPLSETFTFLTTTDDGVKLWVGGELLINRWGDQAATTFDASIDLTAWERIPIRLEMYENQAFAQAKLEWKSESLSREVIPSLFLYPSLSEPLGNIDLQASYGQKEVALRWQFEASDEWASFQIERSPDGETFTPLAEQTVKAPASSASFVDLQPLFDTSYYRIKATNGVGQYQYSPIRQGEIGESWAKIFPNPLGPDRLLNVQLKGLEESRAQMRLLDLQGRLLWSAEIEVAGGSARWQGELPILPAGVYLLQMEAGTRHRIVKLRW
ncbi:MAG: PQQ-dependent sugar dehydrogenase [Bacteroidota bacterium]